MTATFLTGVDLSECPTIQDQDLARLADCTTLRTLDLHHTKLTGACLTHLLGRRMRENSAPASKDDPSPKTELSPAC